MNASYVQKRIVAQKKVSSNETSFLDSSAQSESLQRKADMANNAAQRAEAPRPNNTGMPDNLKAGIESLSGYSMDDVRVHYNSSKPAAVQALAYTRGTDIHVAPGQEKHLPHEAWHVAQQMAGRVTPTTNINGMPVNDNATLEHEADVMGEKAVQCKTRKNNSFNEGYHPCICSQLFRVSWFKNATDLEPLETVNVSLYENLCKYINQVVSAGGSLLLGDLRANVDDVEGVVADRLNVLVASLGVNTFGSVDISGCNTLDEIKSVFGDFETQRINRAEPAEQHNQIWREENCRDDFMETLSNPLIKAANRFIDSWTHIPVRRLSGVEWRLDYQGGTTGNGYSNYQLQLNGPRTGKSSITCVLVKDGVNISLDDFKNAHRRSMENKVKITID